MQLLLVYYDRAVHISVAVGVDTRTLLYRKNFSSRTNGQVAARRVTGLIIKRLCFAFSGLASAFGCDVCIGFSDQPLRVDLSDPHQSVPRRVGAGGG